MELLQTFIERQEEIWIAFQEHVLLSAIAMGIAIAVAVPLGVVLTRYRKLAEPIIGIAAIIQTIPSLALLGFMLPIFGIGKLPAIIALTLYALLRFCVTRTRAFSALTRRSLMPDEGWG